MNHNLRIPSADDQDSFSILQGKISDRITVTLDELDDSSDVIARLSVKDITANSGFAGGCTGPIDNDSRTLGHLKTDDESIIYEHTSDSGPLRIGASDVWLPTNAEGGRVGVISVSSLRRPGERKTAKSTCTGTFLHRLVIKSNGKPMWEYDSDEQLLKAFRDVVQAHRRLCENNIPYHNISPGNMLLNINPAAESESQGILTDMEFVSDSKYDVKRGAIMMGPRTVQFMARELLLGKTQNHQPKHDLESFIWSFSYCVWRKLYQLVRPAADDSDDISDDDDDYEKKRFLTHFASIFSQTDPDEIAERRQSGSAIIAFPSDRRFKNIVRPFMTEPLVDLFQAFVHMIERNHSTNSAIQMPLSHEGLLGAVDTAIAGYA